MMFHRTPGKMDEAVEAMRRYVPYYAETTNGHGRCTDCIMAGEAAPAAGEFCRCRNRAGTRLCPV